MSKIFDSLKKAFEAVKSKTDFSSDDSVAENFKELSRAQKDLKEIIDTDYVPILLGHKVSRTYLQESLEVVFAEGKAKNELDVKEIARQLIKDGRAKDLIEIISISEKDLLTIHGGAVFVAKYKKQVGVGNPTVAVKDISKARMKELLEAANAKNVAQ